MERRCEAVGQLTIPKDSNAKIMTGERHRPQPENDEMALSVNRRQQPVLPKKQTNPGHKLRWDAAEV